MEESQLLLNEAALASMEEAKKPAFIFDWLRRLDKVLSNLASSVLSAKTPSNPKEQETLIKDKDAVRKAQKQLVAQLTGLVQNGGTSVGPTARQLLADCLVALFTVGDTFLLFETINKCNDILKSRDDSLSFLCTRLSAVRVLATMYEKLGRMTGRSFEETISLLSKGLKNAESSTRAETMLAFGKICSGLGSAASALHRDLYKSAKAALTDRSLPVRAAAAQCLQNLAVNWSPLYTTELDSVCQAIFRAFDGANSQARKSISQLLGTLISYSQQPPATSLPSAGNKAGLKASRPGAAKQATLSVEDALNVLLQGYVKGGSGGSGLMITKSGATVGPDVRVGVALAYIAMATKLGGPWLERNLSVFLHHVISCLLSHPKAVTSHSDTVQSRRCVGSIIRLTIGQLLGEKAQLAACKELVNLINNHLGTATGGVSADSPAIVSLVEGHQHVLVVALTELGHLMLRLGSVVAASLLTTVPSSGEGEKPQSSSIGSTRLLEVLVSVLPHSSAAPRAAAAWCLRCMAIACPTHLTPAIDVCLEGLENLRSSPEAVVGYSSALAALLGAVRHTPLGIPHTRGKIVFNVGEELLRSASQNSRMSRERTQAGWLLIGSIMTLGGCVVKGLLPRMMLLWRNAFPRNAKELESEKARGDGFTWKMSLEARAGALASMHSFLQNSPELVTEDIVRRLTSPIEGALMLLGQVPTLLKSYVNELRALVAMLRLRLFETLTLLPPSSMESNYAALLRLLVSEFTLADGQSGTTTSLVSSLCHPEDNILLLGSHSITWPSNVIHSVMSRVLPTIQPASVESASSTGGDDSLEELLLPNSTIAIEHDLTSLYRPLKEGQPQPGPMPLGVAVVDASIMVFGQVFPRAAVKHRAQMLDHFAQHLKVNQSQGQNVKAEAISTNIYSAILASLRGLVDVKAKTLGNDEVKRLAVGIIVSGLVSNSPTIRCTAAECLGRVAQIICDPQFVAESAQKSFDCLKSARDVVSRTGHSVALGCLHRYVGGMGSSQNLQTSVSILMALGQDTASPQVQIWALHSLTTIAESGGPMFRGFVEPTLNMVLKSLLMMTTSSLEVHTCLGKLLSALITSVGPELQDTSKNVLAIRESFSTACEVLGQPNNHPAVRAEAIAGLQQLHMFAPNAVNLALLVPSLCQNLQSPHWALRKASVACLRQFAQREAATMCEIAVNLDNDDEDELGKEIGELVLNKQSGLPGLLFSLLDHEVDPSFMSAIHDAVNSMMHSTAVNNLSSWLSLCREVLTVATEDPLSAGGPVADNAKDKADDDFDDADDDIEFKVGGGDKDKQSNIQPRWKTRVFAALCLRKIIEDCCQGNRAHFDLSLAREMQLSEKSRDFLVLHLSELVRVAFMAATSDSDPLRLEGLKTLEVIIERFGDTPEPEFPGHVILEQYQAQVGAALRPAFAPDTPSNITAAACDVCSAWIGSGVARDLGDLRRVYQLLVTSLAKLKPKLNSQRQVIFNESALTLEKLSILKAWAEVYIVSMKNDVRVRTSFSSSLADQIEPSSTANANEVAEEDDEFGDFEESSSNAVTKQEKELGNRRKKEGLGSLVQSELPSLSRYWLDALRDHALLSLPSEFKSQLPFDGGAFYTHDTINLARPHYRATWPPMLQAAAVWLSYGQGFENGPDSQDNTKTSDETNADIFHLLLGVCIEGLANTRSADLTKEQVTSCLRTLLALLDHVWVRKYLSSANPAESSKGLLVELCNVLHRTVLTRETVATQKLAMDVLRLVLVTTKDILEATKKTMSRELGVPANQAPEDFQDAAHELSLLGEGGSEGSLTPGKSVAFAALEVCLCVLVRHYPELSPRAANLSSAAALRARAGHHRGLIGHGELVNQAVDLLARLPAMCSPMGALSILPSILWLLVGVIKASGEGEDVSGAVQSLKHLIQGRQHFFNDQSLHQWTSLLQSALQRLLDLAKTSDGGDGSSDVNILAAVAIFLLYAPPGVVGEAPGLKYPAVNAYVRAFQQMVNDSASRRRVVLAASQILAAADRGIAQPLAQAVASPILDYLLVDETSRAAKCEADLALTLECVHLVEVLISSPNLASTSGEDKRAAQLLIFLIPILVSHLLAPEDMKEASRLRLTLHEQALAKLTNIGQIWPAYFKNVMGQSEALRGRLEAAVRANQERMKAAANLVQKGREAMEAKSNQPTVPSIKLTMDFGKKYAAN